MTMRMLCVATGLATAVGCGSGMSTSSGGGNTSLSGGSTSTQNDGGALTQTDAGTDEGCDCSGMALPDTCMVCMDGMAACAHFVCAMGTCETQICP